MLRKIIFVICIFVSLVLFIDGISVLALMNSKKDESLRNTRLDSGNGIIQDDIQKMATNEESSISTDEPINILVLGLDEEGERSDVILLLNYNPDVGSINILSVARDTRVRARGKRVKINALIGLGGEKLITGKVEELTGLKVDYYITLDFIGFRKIIDTLGGVEVDVPFDMDYDDPEQNLHIHLKKGRQVLNGIQAEHFARYRKGNTSNEGYSDGDLGRIKAQQQLIKALIDQKAKLKYLHKVDDVYFILQKHMKSNIELYDIQYYMKKFMNNGCDSIRTFTIPGESAYIGGISYFVYDREKLKQIIEENFYR